jgi:hypothetical protein
LLENKVGSLRRDFHQQLKEEEEYRKSSGLQNIFQFIFSGSPVFFFSPLTLTFQSLQYYPTDGLLRRKHCQQSLQLLLSDLHNRLASFKSFKEYDDAVAAVWHTFSFQGDRLEKGIDDRIVLVYFISIFHLLSHLLCYK